MIEEVFVAIGTVALSTQFTYQFLDKYHTRHIGPGPQSISRHRHPNNARQKRGGEVKEFDTMDLTKIRRELNTHSYLMQTGNTPEMLRALENTDPDKTIIIEG